AAAREEVRKAVERYEFDSRGLELVSQRIADLRSSLSDFESRFSGLSESKQAVETLQSKVQALASQIDSFATTIGRLDTEAGKVQALRRDLDALARTAGETSDRMARIEEARPAVEAALKEIEQLGSTHALVKDALEQTRIAAADVARFREEQAETTTWLARVDEMVGGLRERVDELRRMAPTIEFVQKQAKRVNESLAIIESRREFVEDMQRRMAELGALGGALDERGRDLQSRIEAAEQRF